MVTAGKLLAETAMGAGQYFQAFPDYGPERMGAPIRAFTRLSSKPITIHSQIDEPNVVLVLDPTLLGTVLNGVLVDRRARRYGQGYFGYYGSYGPRAG